MLATSSKPPQTKCASRMKLVRASPRLVVVEQAGRSPTFTFEEEPGRPKTRPQATAKAQLQSAVLAAVQVSLLNSAQARQIAIFTRVALAVFCLVAHRPKALSAAPALSNPLAASDKQRKTLCRTASVA
jgi:hypothetical protein